MVLQRPDKQTWHYLLQWLWQSHLGRDSALASTELKKQEHIESSNVYSLYSPKSNFHPFCPNHQWTNCKLGIFFFLMLLNRNITSFKILVKFGSIFKFVFFLTTSSVLDVLQILKWAIHLKKWTKNVCIMQKFTTDQLLTLLLVIIFLTNYSVIATLFNVILKFLNGLPFLINDTSFLDNGLT